MEVTQSNPRSTRDHRLVSDNEEEKEMDKSTEEFLRYALEIGAIEIVPEGRKLKSGRLSPYFFNSGLFTDGEALCELVNAYSKAFEAHPLLGAQDNLPEVVFGPAYKGIPLAIGFSLYGIDGYYLGWAFNRKEEKDHGDGGTLVGASMEGKKVLIIDDVITSGMSSAEAVEIVKAAGGTPIGVLIAFDRQEVGQDGKLSAVQEFEQKFGLPVAAAATLQDLITYLEYNDHPVLESIIGYRRQYGVTANEDNTPPIDENRGDHPLPG